MVAALAELQQSAEWINKELPVFHLRIGLHTGPVVAGLLGMRYKVSRLLMDSIYSLDKRQGEYAPSVVEHAPSVVEYAPSVVTSLDPYNYLLLSTTFCTWILTTSLWETQVSSSVQAHKVIQIYTNTDYCPVAFCISALGS
jgi:hypothetical protein